MHWFLINIEVIVRRCKMWGLARSRVCALGCRGIGVGGGTRDRGGSGEGGSSCLRLAGEAKSGHAGDDGLLVLAEDLNQIQEKDQQGWDDLRKEVRAPEIVGVDFVAVGGVLPDDQSATSRKDGSEEQGDAHHLQDKSELSVVLLGSAQRNTDSGTIERERDSNGQEEEANDGQRGHVKCVDLLLTDKSKEIGLFPFSFVMRSSAAAVSSMTLGTLGALVITAMVTTASRGATGGGVTTAVRT